MGWTGGKLEGARTAHNLIVFELGEEFARRVLATAKKGKIVYAAVRVHDGDAVFGLVLLTDSAGGITYTKAMSEDMGPCEYECPAKILDLLTAEPNAYASEWRERCRARLSAKAARRTPKAGEKVKFPVAFKFTGMLAEYDTLTFTGKGSIFTFPSGGRCRVPGWREMAYEVVE